MICVPIRKKRINSILKILSLAEKEADLTEVFFDEINNLNTEKLNIIFSQKRKPIIYKSYANKEKIDQVLEFKPEYIDLDIKTSLSIIKSVKVKSPKTKIIISYHNFEKTPEIKDLKKIIKEMKKKGADIYKIATYANDFTDSLRILSFLSEIKEQKLDAICLAMGKAGKITRATGHLLGNYLMYAPLDQNDKTASGQIILKELKKCHLK